MKRAKLPFCSCASAQSILDSRRIGSSIGQTRMATLKEFEEALRLNEMTNALAILDALKKRDRERRSIAPARRVVGRKMTAELARSILDLHATTGMTQQEIAFKLGVNQGRVNEVIKRGKWLSADPHAPEALSRDKAMDRLTQRAQARRSDRAAAPVRPNRVPVKAPSPTIPPRAIRQVKELGSPALPLDVASQPEADRSMTRMRSAATRSAAAPTPIVSAQLAFLDL